MLRIVYGAKDEWAGVDNSPASDDAFAPSQMGKTRFFSRMRMACVTLRREVEELMTEAAEFRPTNEPSKLPQRFASKLDAVFETAVTALTDQMYGAFQLAGSKPVMAARFREVIRQRETAVKDAEAEYEAATAAAAAAHAAETEAAAAKATKALVSQRRVMVDLLTRLETYKKLSGTVQLLRDQNSRLRDQIESLTKVDGAASRAKREAATKDAFDEARNQEKLNAKMEDEMEKSRAYAMQVAILKSDNLKLKQENAGLKAELEHARTRVEIVGELQGWLEHDGQVSLEAWRQGMGEGAGKDVLEAMDKGEYGLTRALYHVCAPGKMKGAYNMLATRQWIATFLPRAASLPDYEPPPPPPPPPPKPSMSSAPGHEGGTLWERARERELMKTWWADIGVVPPPNEGSEVEDGEDEADKASDDSDNLNEESEEDGEESEDEGSSRPRGRMSVGPMSVDKFSDFVVEVYRQKAREDAESDAAGLPLPHSTIPAVAVGLLLDRHCNTVGVDMSEAIVKVEEDLAALIATVYEEAETLPAASLFGKLCGLFPLNHPMAGPGDTRAPLTPGAADFAFAILAKLYGGRKKAAKMEAVQLPDGRSIATVDDVSAAVKAACAALREPETGGCLHAATKGCASLPRHNNDDMIDVDEAAMTAAAAWEASTKQGSGGHAAIRAAFRTVVDVSLTVNGVALTIIDVGVILHMVKPDVTRQVILTIYEEALEMSASKNEGDEDRDDETVMKGYITEDCFVDAASRHLPRVDAAEKAIAAARCKHGFDAVHSVWKEIEGVVESQLLAAAAVDNDQSIPANDVHQSLHNAIVSTNQDIADVAAFIRAGSEDARSDYTAALISTIASTVGDCFSASRLAVSSTIPEVPLPPPVMVSAGVQTIFWMDDAETQTETTTPAEHLASASGLEALTGVEDSLRDLHNHLSEGRRELEAVVAEKDGCLKSVEEAKTLMGDMREEMNTLLQQLAGERKLPSEVVQQAIGKDAAISHPGSFKVTVSTQSQTEPRGLEPDPYLRPGSAPPDRARRPGQTPGDAGTDHFMDHGGLTEPFRLSEVDEDHFLQQPSRMPSQGYGPGGRPLRRTLGNHMSRPRVALPPGPPPQHRG